MKKIFTTILLAIALLGCRNINQNYTSVDESISYEEQKANLYAVNQIIEAPTLDDGEEQDDEYLIDSEIVMFIQNILSTAPLELDQSELRQYTLSYVHFGNYLGVIGRGHWEFPSQLDTEIFLRWYEFFEFNLRYVPQYLEMNPKLSELVVNEETVELLISQYIEVDIERLRQSYMYDKELRGYRFRVMDGLGGISSLYANSVWRYEQFIVIEVRNNMDATMNTPAEEIYVAYALIEIIDEESFMFRAYIQFL